MYPTTILEWWHDGQWREIGWRAFNPREAADLRKHAEALVAEKGGDYRMVHPSIYRDGPPVIIWERRLSQRTGSVEP